MGAIRMKKYLIKTLKFSAAIIFSIVAFVLVYLGCAFCLSRIAVDKEPNTKEEVAIYIRTNGVHTDIVVPVKNSLMDWSQEIKYENAKEVDASYNYLGMGWGDKGFYLDTPTWAELKYSTAFRAAFALSTTAIHATFHKDIVESETCKKIMISNEQYQRLITYITNSLQKDINGHFIHIKTNSVYSKTDAFYEAKGSYHMLHTCNTWANNALKSSGQKACLWTPFDTGIFLKYQN
jgi:uncharacterized protein (TIGR02117 family)